MKIPDFNPAEGKGFRIPVENSWEHFVRYCGIFAIDSYHITGGHFPSVTMTQIVDEDEVIVQLLRLIKSHNVTEITYKTLRDAICEAKQNHRYIVQIPFNYPREGEIQIRFNMT